MPYISKSAGLPRQTESIGPATLNAIWPMGIFLAIDMDLSSNFLSPRQRELNCSLLHGGHDLACVDNLFTQSKETSSLQRHWSKKGATDPTLTVTDEHISATRHPFVRPSDGARRRLALSDGGTRLRRAFDGLFVFPRGHSDQMFDDCNNAQVT